MGPYRWANPAGPPALGDLPKLPRKWAKAIKAAGKRDGSKAIPPGDPRLTDPAQGRQNSTLYAAGLWVRQRGGTETVLQEYLHKLARQCNPPHDPRRVDTIIDSLIRHVTPNETWNDDMLRLRIDGDISELEVDSDLSAVWLVLARRRGERWVQDERVGGSDKGFYRRVDGEHWTEATAAVKQHMFELCSGLPKRLRSVRVQENALRYIHWSGGAGFRYDVPFDEKDRVIGLPGGDVIDLTAAEAGLQVRPARDEEFVRYSLPVGVADNCDQWAALVESWFGADQATIDVLGSAACYSLMGRPRLHQMFWLWGPTGGGKNTFLDGLAAALGKYSFAFDMDLLTDNHPPHDGKTFPFAGRRMLYSSEASERRTLNAKLVKQLTGDKTFHLRPMRGHGFNAPVSWVLWAAMNKRPRLASVDDSLRARLVLIRWPEKDWREAENRDVDLPDRIERDLRGEILHWALGYRDNYETILRQLTPRIRNDTNLFIDGEDGII